MVVADKSYECTPLGYPPKRKEKMKNNPSPNRFHINVDTPDHLKL